MNKKIIIIRNCILKEKEKIKPFKWDKFLKQEKAEF